MIKKKNKYPMRFKKTGYIAIPALLFFLHLLIIGLSVEKLNYYLLVSDKKQTIAVIKNCYKSKGTEWCVYSYVVDNTRYEIKYSNDAPKLKLREFDTTTVFYYSKLPVISKLKREME